MKTILLVEDDKAIGMMVPQLIDCACEGCTVLVAETHHQAMEMVAQHPDISLVFMDGNLNPAIKQLDTLDLVGFVRKNCPHAVIVATSSNDEWRQQLMDHGCDYSMPKTSLASVENLRAILQPVSVAA